MFGLSGEHLLILAGVLLIFGPRKLPELGSSIGKAMKNFKEGLNGPTNSGRIESTTVNTTTTTAAPTMTATSAPKNDNHPQANA